MLLLLLHASAARAKMNLFFAAVLWNESASPGTFLSLSCPLDEKSLLPTRKQMNEASPRQSSEATATENTLNATLVVTLHACYHKC